MKTEAERFENPKDEKIKEILTNSKNVAVVGLSPNLSRPSFWVANYLRKNNFKIIPVNPKYQQILGERPFPKLTDVLDEIDVVNIFRRSEYVMPVVEDAIKIKAKVVWMQEGVINFEAAEKAKKNNILVVMDRCISKEHRRLF